MSYYFPESFIIPLIYWRRSRENDIHKRENKTNGNEKLQSTRYTVDALKLPIQARLTFDGSLKVHTVWHWYNIYLSTLSIYSID